MGHGSYAKTVDKLAHTYYFNVGEKKSSLASLNTFLVNEAWCCSVVWQTRRGAGSAGGFQTLFILPQHLFEYFLKVSSCRILAVKLPLVLLLLKLELILLPFRLPE